MPWILTVLVGWLLSAPVTATPITYYVYDLTTGGIQNGMDASFGQGDETLFVRAYSASPSTGLFTAGTVGLRSQGLGVCDAFEPNCLSDARRPPVDNELQEDWLFLTFPLGSGFQKVPFISITIVQPQGSAERYYTTYWMGELLDAELSAGLSGKDLDDFGTGTNGSPPAGNACANCYTIDLTGKSGNYMLIGARAGSQSDFLYVSSLTVDFPDAGTVPEPNSFVLFASVLTLFVGLRGRRTA